MLKPITSTYAVVLLAGGSGSRMGSATQDKILLRLEGKPVISYSIDVFSQLDNLTEIIIVVRDEVQMQEIQSVIHQTPQNETHFRFCLGGTERQFSVLNGLETIQSNPDYVFIHDAARPLIKKSELAKMQSLIQEHGAVTLAHRVTDTIKKVKNSNPTNEIAHLEDLPRNQLWAMETPQSFQYKNILAAYRQVKEKKLTITDDNSAYEEIGEKILILENTFPNPKITYPSDIYYLEFLLNQHHETIR
jgi:2-C-methyl-D-erythritol 4-phosphate cytidylyltransferase